ncbi:hypothetical protein [Gordonia sp. i37]|nr:hypothetical protein [Gordonia sp. i37]
MTIFDPEVAAIIADHADDIDPDPDADETTDPGLVERLFRGLNL